jgi:hypothetical protein
MSEPAAVEVRSRKRAEIPWALAVAGGKARASDQRQIRALSAAWAFAGALIIVSFCTKPLSQPAPAPQGPSGFYALEVYFAGDGRREVWDAVKTRQILTGFWLLKQSQGETPAQFNSEDRNLAARLKNRSVGTEVGIIHYVVNWDRIAHIELTFQDAGSTKVREVQPLALCTECGRDWLPPPGIYFSWDEFTPNLRQAMQGYMNQDIMPMTEKVGKVDRSGSFVLRVTDASNNVFYLPIAHASWHVNHYDDGRSTPFRSEDSEEIQPILQ